MIINSNFHDYYDSLAGKYRDEKVVFDRIQQQFIRLRRANPQVIQGGAKEIPKQFNKLIERYCRIGTEGVGYYCKNEDWIGAILLCGVAYPFSYSEADKTKNFKTPYEDVYKESSQKIYRYLNPNFVIKKKYSGEGIQDDQVREINLEFGPVILIEKGYVEINPNLEKSNFHLDPFIIFQQISSFLMSKEPNVPEMEDGVKIEARGFDSLSFKREKGGPTRKRKKLK